MNQMTRVHWSIKLLRSDRQRVSRQSHVGTARATVSLMGKCSAISSKASMALCVPVTLKLISVSESDVTGSSGTEDTSTTSLSLVRLHVTVQFSTSQKGSWRELLSAAQQGCQLRTIHLRVAHLRKIATSVAKRYEIWVICCADGWRS